MRGVVLVSHTKILVVGKGFFAYRGYILEEMHAAGLEIWLADDEVDEHSDIGIISKSIKINFGADPISEAERLLCKSKHWSNVTGICYIEGLLFWAADFFAKLGIYFLSPYQTNLVRSKYAQREAFMHANIMTPKYSVGSPTSLQKQSIDFPIVIKPEKGYSSIGVQFVCSKAELREYFNTKNNVYSDNFIVESVILGQEYSIEGYVQNGNAVALAKTVKFKTPLPFFEEIGHFCSREIKPSPLEKEFFIQVVRALDIRDSIFHLEYFQSNNKLIPVEIAGRLGGDKIPYLQRRVTGTSLVLSYLGIPHKFISTVTSGIGIVFFIPTEGGIVSNNFPSLDLSNTLQEHYMEVKPGQKVAAAPKDFFVRLGFSIVEANSMEEFISISNERISLFEKDSGVKLHRLVSPDNKSLENERI
ncbi:argininosuccinate lyase [Bartonella doshiae]|uniref:Argininosuccinate lyase n=2 Tax=Bartonella doshiae TaxID=33044 RepID=A0A380ZGF8_BARDO|nr:hypothetical protein MCS_01366 [Bartonella doshiae NCTC 12862 = ATCC 700133]SUV45392.1 argininosuccinate lyase [Bartonella doshiae]